jgi:hypothetical protein
MMVTNPDPARSTAEGQHVANGGAMAAFLGAGVGAFAMGMVVLANEAGLFTAPSLYGPAGGVSGRTTMATCIWLVAWGVLHLRWRNRDVAPFGIGLLTMLLIVFGIAGTFPPVWRLL